MKFEEMINTIQLGDCYELIKQYEEKLKIKSLRKEAKNEPKKM